MNDAIVTLEVIAVFEQSKEVKITASIGRACPEGDAWACAVELAPVYTQAMSVKGVDSFHATWLACSLVLKLLAQLKSTGAALRGADGSEFPIDAYLAGLGSDAAGG
jgi:hypothetical protein